MFGQCPNQVQLKLFNGYISPAPGSPACLDAKNVRAWLNTNAYSTLSPGWSSEPEGWEITWTANFDNTSATAPDVSTITGPTGAGLPGGSVYPVPSQYGIDTCFWGSFLIPSPAAVIVGLWCDEETGNVYYQQSCTMTGTPIGGCGCSHKGWEYVLPVPPESLCVGGFSETCEFPSYFLVPLGDYGSWFGQTWAGFVSGCTGGTLDHPCKSGVGVATPAACLSPDPFFGSDP